MKRVFVLITAALFATYFGVLLLTPAEPIFFHDEGNRQVEVPVTAALNLQFTRPVEKSGVNLSIYPEVEGKWELSGNKILKHAKFIPTEKLAPTTQYKIVVIGTRNYFSKIRTKEREITFVTEHPAVIVRGTGLGEIYKNFPTDGHLEFVFNKPNRVRDVEFLLMPSVESRMESSGSTLKVFFNKKLESATQYKYRLIDKSLETEDKTFATGEIQTAYPPKIKAMSPVGTHVRVDSQIVIEFEEEMNVSTVLSTFFIQPGVIMKSNFATASKYIFTPSSLSYATKYTFGFKPGLQTSAGGILEQNLGGTFETIGYVVVTDSSPKSGATGVALDANISIVFDQEVDHESAQSHFSISPGMAGSFSWKGNIMTFDPSSNLPNDTRYTVNIAPGVKSIYGLDSKDIFSINFTTKSSSRVLNVPSYYQQYALSCEEASLRSALAFYGVYANDWQILQRVGYAPRNRDTASNSWDNPAKMFVGFVDGRQNTTGYGAHWQAIANAAKSYGRNATAFSGWSASNLAQEISNGHPVVIWGIYGTKINDGWNSSDGWINAPKGEHTRTVIGFTGSVSNPTSFILIDPLAGRITWSKSKLLGNWGAFNNSGVVVY